MKYITNQLYPFELGLIYWTFSNSQTDYKVSTKIIDVQLKTLWGASDQTTGQLGRKKEHVPRENKLYMYSNNSIYIDKKPRANLSYDLKEGKNSLIRRDIGCS